ncbi:MAG: ribonuclease R [Myxococcales bacterium]|nr:ribonuclease R [Myxococcales bacterium]MCB9524436.1 ribonuclease R [Myxococcales bacterium]
MLPDDETLLKAIPAPPGDVHFRTLLKQFSVDRNERPHLRTQLRALAATGKVDRLRGNRFARPTVADGQVGTLTLHPRGFGFVQLDGGGESVYVDPRSLGRAMHRDRVRLRVESRGDGRSAGVVVGVVERGTHTFVGTLRGQRDRWVVHPQDPRLPDHMPAEPGPGADGDTVAVRILRFPGDPAGPMGEVFKVFDPDPTVTQATDLIVYDLGLRLDFPDEALAEAAAASPPSEADLAERLDLRDRALVTIDPHSARDFDDALHARPRDEGGWRVTVAIADVAHYVRPDSALDTEAQARGTSVYLPDRVLPMLPERLSSDLCSLRPGEDRLAMAIEFDVAPDGTLANAQMANAVIRSHARLTYDRVARMLGLRSDEDEPTPDDEPAVEALRPSLEALLAATRARRRLRARRGFLNLEVGEPRIWFAEDGSVEDVRSAERHEAHLLVEDAMLAANELVAEWFAERELPALFRVHDRPPPEGLSRLRAQAADLGAPLELKGRPSPTILNRYLRQQADHPLASLLHLMLLRSMAKAVYDEEPAPHFGLGAPFYLHFTSPIRRYPDLVVHRLWKRAALGQPLEDADALDALAEHCSRRERVAQDAERTVLDMYKARFLADRVGEKYVGTVVGVVPLGLFVQLDAHAVEGLVNIERLHDDEYRFDKESGALIGRRTKRRIGLGARLEIAVRKVDVEARRVDFDLVRRVGRRMTAD